MFRFCGSKSFNKAQKWLEITLKSLEMVETTQKNATTLYFTRHEIQHIGFGASMDQYYCQYLESLLVNTQYQFLER